MDYLKQDTDKICYMILPEGIRGDLSDGLKTLSEQHAVSIVVIDGANWNDDLTPWPAVGVFKKAKPFGGKSAAFLKKLTDMVIPEAETHLGIKDAKRTLLGVSLSGLFAIWSAFNTDAFTNLISLSGSLWYDGFTDWMKGQTPSPRRRRTPKKSGWLPWRSKPWLR